MTLFTDCILEISFVLKVVCSRISSSAKLKKKCFEPFFYVEKTKTKKNEKPFKIKKLNFSIMF